MSVGLAGSHLWLCSICGYVGTTASRISGSKSIGKGDTTTQYDTEVCRIIEMTVLLHETIERSQSIMHNGFKISYNEISYTVTVDHSTVASSAGVERIGGNGKRQGINRQEMWIEWKGGSTYRSPTFQRFYSSSESEASTFNPSQKCICADRSISKIRGASIC
jgi:hypothetical protein